MNLVKLQQSGHILERLLKEAERMGNTTMSVSVPELKLFQEVSRALWVELNQARTKADKAEATLKRVQEALASTQTREE
jgi:predicted NUDIX family NTP pyrophosphohydrolase